MAGGEDPAAQNFGMHELPPREARYAMADDHVDVVCQLFQSWQPGAVVMDRATSTYADHARVWPIDFEGQYFKRRGPLNTVPSPQGRPVFVQAGGSPRGRGFAAKHADSIIATANGARAVKQYRDDVRARAAAAGRNPDDIKLLYLVYPTLGETDADADARERHARQISTPGFIEASLAAIGSITDIDFSVYDPDQRKLVGERFEGGIDLIGSAETVADTMGALMEEIGGDGFLISTPFQRISRCDAAAWSGPNTGAPPSGTPCWNSHLASLRIQY